MVKATTPLAIFVITFSIAPVICDHKVNIHLLQYVLLAVKYCLMIKLYTF